MWIPSNQELGRHPKTRRAAKQLEVSQPAIIGHLHYLWWWALDFAQVGDLSEFDSAEIAEAAMWDGDPAMFIQALLDVGFLDRDSNVSETLRLHDWADYGGKMVEEKHRNAQRQQEYRDRKAAQKEAKKPRNNNVTVTSQLRNELDKKREEKSTEDNNISGGVRKLRAQEAPPPQSSKSPNGVIPEFAPYPATIAALREVCALPEHLPKRDFEELKRLLPQLAECGTNDEAVATAVRVRFGNESWPHKSPPRLSQILPEWKRQEVTAARIKASGGNNGTHETADERRERKREFERNLENERLSRIAEIGSQLNGTGGDHPSNAPRMLSHGKP